jgi:hypothetical protein
MSNARLGLAFVAGGAERLVRDADQWRGSGRTGRFSRHIPSPPRAPFFPRAWGTSRFPTPLPAHEPTENDS